MVVTAVHAAQASHAAQSFAAPHLDHGEVHVPALAPGDDLAGDEGRHHRVRRTVQDAHRAPHLLAGQEFARSSSENIALFTASADIQPRFRAALAGYDLHDIRML